MNRPEINIYIETSIKGPKVQMGAYLYLSIYWLRTHFTFTSEPLAETVGKEWMEECKG